MGWAAAAGLVLLAAVLKAAPVIWRAVVQAGQVPSRLEDIWTAVPEMKTEMAKLHDCFERHSQDDERRFDELKKAIGDAK